MPPKKKAAEEEISGAEKIARFGRVKNNLKMGLVGLPNVGKSSLFNLLTDQAVPAEVRLTGTPTPFHLSTAAVVAWCLFPDVAVQCIHVRGGKCRLLKRSSSELLSPWRHIHGAAIRSHRSLH